MRLAWIPLILLAAALAAFGANPAWGDEPDCSGSSDYQYILSFTFENDIFCGLDNYYTSGARLSLLSAPVEGMGPKGYRRKVLEATSFLPFLGDEDRSHFFSESLNMAICTPEDITRRVPEEGDPPYSGIWFSNTGIHSRSRDSLHSYFLGLGWVGPSTQVDNVQHTIHQITGSDIPKGWHTQLRDEPLVNLYYQYSRKLLELDVFDSLDLDLLGNCGGGAGNFYVGGNTGITCRLGKTLEGSFGPRNNFMMENIRTALLGAKQGPENLFCFVFLGLGGHGIAHLLPLDGNTFQDSRSVKKNPWVGSLMGGLALGNDHFVLTWSMYTTTAMCAKKNENTSYGSITISRFF
jgi:hypothetical protein